MKRTYQPKNSRQLGNSDFYPETRQRVAKKSLKGVGKREENICQHLKGLPFYEKSQRQQFDNRHNVR